MRTYWHDEDAQIDATLDEMARIFDRLNLARSADEVGRLRAELDDRRHQCERLEAVLAIKKAPTRVALRQANTRRTA